MPGAPHFFVDRSLGRIRVSGRLRAAGWELTTLAEHYGIPADETSPTSSGSPSPAPEAGPFWWFHLSDEAVEDQINDSYAMRKFMGLDFATEQVPDATTLLHFRHLLEAHTLGGAMFAALNRLFEANGWMMRGGSIVDATIIAAPSSTKNATGTRDPEMHQTKKGNQWHFG